MVTSDQGGSRGSRKPGVAKRFMFPGRAEEMRSLDQEHLLEVKPGDPYIQAALVNTSGPRRIHTRKEVVERQRS